MIKTRNSPTRLLVLAALSLLSGCLSLDSQLPSWISSYPNVIGYFVGVGSSRTGDRGADLELARAAALVDLVSSISVRIQGEQTFVTSDIGGEVEVAVVSVISESVNEHIQQVEVVDSYYSEELGFWFFVRLNQADWENIQRREMEQLSRRVVGIVEADFDRDESTVATRITSLARGFSLVSASPYGRIVEAELLGSFGLLLDLVESGLQNQLGSLGLAIYPEQMDFESGSRADFVIQIRQAGPPPGTIPIQCADSDGRILASLVTGRGGEWSGSIGTESLPIGSWTIECFLDFGALGVSEELLGARNPPTAQLRVDVLRIMAGFSISTGEAIEIDNVAAPFRSLLSRDIALKHDPPTPSDAIRIEVELTSRSGPISELTEGLAFEFLRATVSVIVNDAIRYSFDSGEVKGGGLDALQAQSRAFADLILLVGDSVDLRLALDEIGHSD